MGAVPGFETKEAKDCHPLLQEAFDIFAGPGKIIGIYNGSPFWKINERLVASEPSELGGAPQIPEWQGVGQIELATVKVFNALEAAGIDLDVGGELDDVSAALSELQDAAHEAEMAAVWNSTEDIQKNHGADLCARVMLDFLRDNDGRVPSFGGPLLNELGREIRALQLKNLTLQAKADGYTEYVGDLERMLNDKRDEISLVKIALKAIIRSEK
jgi:hypothetical protein